MMCVVFSVKIRESDEQRHRCEQHLLEARLDIDHLNRTLCTEVASRKRQEGVLLDQHQNQQTLIAELRCDY